MPSLASLRAKGMLRCVTASARSFSRFRLPSTDNVAAVNRLARTTGSNPVPHGKADRGYRHEREKFRIAGLTSVASETVAAPRVLECPVQLEAVVETTHNLAAGDQKLSGRVFIIEVRI